MKHYENISSKEATEEDYLVENLDWEEQLYKERILNRDCEKKSVNKILL